MDALLFIATFICLGLVVVWYVANEQAGTRGEKGFLAIAPDERAIEAPSYREKKRGSTAPAANSDPEGATQAFKERRGGFRDKDEEAYRSTGPLPRFTGKPTRLPEKGES